VSGLSLGLWASSLAESAGESANRFTSRAFGNDCGGDLDDGYRIEDAVESSLDKFERRQKVKELWALGFGIVATYFFFLAKMAAKEPPQPPEKPKEPEPLPEPFISWRFTVEQVNGYTVFSTIALDMNPTTERFLATHEWVRLP
jgi:hypothetical protein